MFYYFNDFNGRHEVSPVIQYDVFGNPLPDNYREERTAELAVMFPNTIYFTGYIPELER